MVRIDTQCTGLTKDGRHCRNTPVPGSETCRYHGENGLATTVYPLKSANVIPKRYNLSGKLAENYERAMKTGTELLDATDEMAVLVARSQALLEEADDYPIVNREVFHAFDAFMVSRASGQVVRMQEALARLELAITQCRQSNERYKELWSVMELLRRTRETEQKRRLSMRQILTIEDARRFFASIQSAILIAIEEIDDPDEKQDFKRAFSEQMNKAFMGNGLPVTEN